MSNGCIHELFEVQAERNPEAIAVEFGEDELTYGELNSQANKLARHLQALGIGPETTVAICVERSLEMLVAILGVLKAGGAYVPLDATYPESRLSYVLDDCASPVVLVHEPTKSKIVSAAKQMKNSDRCTGFAGNRAIG